MPEHGIVMQARVAEFFGTPPLPVFPVYLFEENRLSGTNDLAETLTSGFSTLTRTGVSANIGGQIPVNIAARMAFLFNRNTPVACDASLNALFVDAGLPAVASGDARIPQTTSVVFYFDPSIKRNSVETHVYRGREVAGSGRSTVTLIRVSGSARLWRSLGSGFGCGRGALHRK